MIADFWFNLERQESLQQMLWLSISMLIQQESSQIANTNTFQTTPTPDPEKLYQCYSAMKQERTCFWKVLSEYALKFRCPWSGNRSKHDPGAGG